MYKIQSITIFIYSMTLTQTEKGYPPPIEHVGIPASIREEKGKFNITLLYKSEKFRHQKQKKKTAVIILKFEQCGLIIYLCIQKMQNGKHCRMSI